MTGVLYSNIDASARKGFRFVLSVQSISEGTGRNHEHYRSGIPDRDVAYQTWCAEQDSGPFGYKADKWGEFLIFRMKSRQASIRNTDSVSSD